jgi:hypothetical protein
LWLPNDEQLLGSALRKATMLHECAFSSSSTLLIKKATTTKKALLHVQHRSTGFELFFSLFPSFSNGDVHTTFPLCVHQRPRLPLKKKKKTHNYRALLSSRTTYCTSPFSFNIFFTKLRFFISPFFCGFRFLYAFKNPLLFIWLFSVLNYSISPNSNSVFFFKFQLLIIFLALHFDLVFCLFSSLVSS